MKHTPGEDRCSARSGLERAQAGRIRTQSSALLLTSCGTVQGARRLCADIFVGKTRKQHFHPCRLNVRISAYKTC